MSSNALDVSVVQAKTFATFRILLGCVWLLNVWFHSHAHYLNHYEALYIAGASGQPNWLHTYIMGAAHLIQMIGAHEVATATVFLEALLALALLTGIATRFFCWVGIAYTLFIWSTIGGLGGPITQGYTDPGAGIVYTLLFAMVLATRGWEMLNLRGVFTTSPAKPPTLALRAETLRLVRVLYGLLWAYDAFWKWHPYFLHHFISNLTPAIQGQPAWITAYIEFIIHALNVIGPQFAAFLTAIVETAIAVSLLSGKGLRLFIPIGILLSLGIWTTAEGWGGPYGPGLSWSGINDDLFGNAINYAFLFGYFWVLHPPFPARGKWQSPQPSSVTPATPY